MAESVRQHWSSDRACCLIFNQQVDVFWKDNIFDPRPFPRLGGVSVYPLAFPPESKIIISIKPCSIIAMLPEGWNFWRSFGTFCIYLAQPVDISYLPSWRIDASLPLAPGRIDIATYPVRFDTQGAQDLKITLQRGLMPILIPVEPAINVADVAETAELELIEVKPALNAAPELAEPVSGPITLHFISQKRGLEDATESVPKRAKSPEELSIETPAETPAETPEQPAETSAETPEQPAETPAETPEQPVETPVETPTATQAETPAETTATEPTAEKTPEQPTKVPAWPPGRPPNRRFDWKVTKSFKEGSTTTPIKPCALDPIMRVDNPESYSYRHYCSHIRLDESIRFPPSAARWPELVLRMERSSAIRWAMETGLTADQTEILIKDSIRAWRALRARLNK